MNYQPNQLEFESALSTTHGFFYMKLSQWAEAIPNFDNAIEISPNNWTALQARALCQSMLFSNVPNANKPQLISEIISDLTESIKYLDEIRNIMLDMQS